MFDNPNEELKRLEKELLAQEEEDWLEKELREAKALINMEDEKPDVDATQVFKAPAQAQTRPQTQTQTQAGVQPRNYANNYGAAQAAPRNTDKTDVNLEEYSDEVYEEPKEKSSRGLVILACLETLGIVAVVLYWLLFLL